MIINFNKKQITCKALVSATLTKDAKKTYCLSRRKYTKNTDLRIVKSKNERSMIQSNCAICGSKKSRFIKEQQAKGLLSNLGIKTPLSKVPLLNILF